MNAHTIDKKKKKEKTTKDERNKTKKKKKTWEKAQKNQKQSDPRPSPAPYPPPPPPHRANPPGGQRPKRNRIKPSIPVRRANSEHLTPEVYRKKETARSIPNR